jgi:predicted transcriptional regulator
MASTLVNHKFRSEVKVALYQRNMTVTALARIIGRPRRTVSRAIHGARFPRVLTLIRRELGLQTESDANPPALL